MTEPGTSEEGSDPDWVVSISELLRCAPQPAVVLPLHDIVAELTRFLAHTNSTSWRTSRPSLLADLAAARLATGKNLRQAIGETLDAYASAIEATPTDAPVTDSQRHEATSIGDVLRKQLATPSALRAAWMDGLHLAGSVTESPEVSATWLQSFRTMLEVAGHDPKATTHELAQLLEDDATAITSARIRLFALPAPTDWSPLHRAAADLTLEQRLTLCEQVISSPPAGGRCVAWIAFKDAAIAGCVLEAGPVTFLEAQWAVPNAVSDSGQNFWVVMSFAGRQCSRQTRPALCSSGSTWASEAP